jgi:hypothetical protein
MWVRCSVLVRVVHAFVPVGAQNRLGVVDTLGTPWCNIYIRILENLCLYTPVPPTAMSRGFEAQHRHATPPWQGGASTVNHHDCGFPREGHHVAPAWVLVEFHTPGRGPRDHETLHHVMVLQLVPDMVHVVWAGLLEEFLEVVSRWPRLTLVVVHDSHDVPNAGATRLPVVVVIVVDRGRSL